MIIGNKRYCDECNSDNTQRYIDGWLLIDYCINCAVKRKLF